MSAVFIVVLLSVSTLTSPSFVSTDPNVPSAGQDDLTASRPPVCSFDLTKEMFLSCAFEVFGKVQGVWFRKHTAEEARRLQLVGTVRNTDRGTVQGVIQGTPTNVQVMKVWLREKGSPMSRIDRAVFTEEKEIASLEYDTFDILR